MGGHVALEPHWKINFSHCLTKNVLNQFSDLTCDDLWFSTAVTKPFSKRQRLPFCNDSQKNVLVLNEILNVFQSTAASL